MKIPNHTNDILSLARIVSEDSQLADDVVHIGPKSSKDS